MTLNLLFPGRIMRVCHWNASPGFISAASAALEGHLRQLVQVDIKQLKGLDHPDASKCDLLIISAEGVDDEQFAAWVSSISSRIPRIEGILVPTLIFSSVTPSIQRDLLTWAVEGNWYFDIVDPGHLSSLPIRVANFLRLNDHLHEIRRMAETTSLLMTKVQDMELRLASALKSTGGS